jgi:hypothetical protein
MFEEPATCLDFSPHRQSGQRLKSSPSTYLLNLSKGHFCKEEHALFQKFR